MTNTPFIGATEKQPRDDQKKQKKKNRESTYAYVCVCVSWQPFYSAAQNCGPHVLQVRKPKKITKKCAKNYNESQHECPHQYIYIYIHAHTMLLFQTTYRANSGILSYSEKIGEPQRQGAPRHRYTHNWSSYSCVRVSITGVAQPRSYVRRRRRCRALLDAPETPKMARASRIGVAEGCAARVGGARRRCAVRAPNAIGAAQPRDERRPTRRGLSARRPVRRRRRRARSRPAFT